MNLSIRPVKPGDLEAITSLDHLAESDPARHHHISEAVKAGEAWIAESSGNAVGYAILDHGFFDQGFISLVIVAPDNRREGAGTALVRHLERICRTGKLFTSTNESNLPMQALLEKLGFCRSGIIHNLDEGDPEIIYFKDVDSPASKGTE